MLYVEYVNSAQPFITLQIQYAVEKYCLWLIRMGN